VTVRDRAKSRIREAFAIGSTVGGVAIGVGIAVAASSPSLVAAPQTAEAPIIGQEQLAPPPPRVLGYTILRDSSLTTDTAGGLRILSGSDLAVTGPFVPAGPADDVAAGLAAHAPKAKPQRPAPAHPSPAPGVPPAPTTVATPEADFPGRGEEHRSESADPKRSERANEQAEVLSDKGDGKHDGE